MMSRVTIHKRLRDETRSRFLLGLKCRLQEFCWEQKAEIRMEILNIPLLQKIPGCGTSQHSWSWPGGGRGWGFRGFFPLISRWRSEC